MCYLPTILTTLLPHSSPTAFRDQARPGAGLWPQLAAVPPSRYQFLRSCSAVPTNPFPTLQDALKQL